MEEKEKAYDENIAIGIAMFAFFALIIAIYFLFKTQEWKKWTHKTTMAKRYGLSKSETLMNWISLYCPDDVIEKYVGNKKHFVRDIDITTHLGEPESYPKDEKGNDVSSKSEIAQFLHLSSKTFLRRIEKIEEPERVIGMSLEQYKNQKRLPPKYVNLIIEHLNPQSLL